MGSEHSVETYLQIRNETNRDFTISVSEIDNYDWHGDNRPDHNFHNVKIKRKSSTRRREDINEKALWCPFKMTLYFSDGTIDSFRIHQRYAHSCCPSFQHFEKSHKIEYERGSGKELIITVKNTWSQSQNEKAETLNEQGEKAMRMRMFSSAVSKFEEAHNLANESETITIVEKNLEEARIYRLNEEAKELEEEKKFEEAFKKYDEALNLARDQLFVDTIKENKSKSLVKFGRYLYEEAWNLESNQNEDRSEKAATKFQKSKNIFQLIPGQEVNVKIVELKISGNQLYNQAFEEEKKALQLFENVKKSQNSDFTEVKNKYKHVLRMYEDVVKKFNEGSAYDQKFSESANFVRDQIVYVEKKMEEVNNEDLVFKLRKVQVDVKTVTVTDEEGAELEEKNTVTGAI